MLTEPASGYLYINDVRLEGIKREQGMAQRAGLRVNMADVFKVDLDWKHSDDAYHGLDSRVGSGIDHPAGGRAAPASRANRGAVGRGRCHRALGGGCAQGACPDHG
jgi:hypothetical protein